jgi:hypothetical protein
MRKSQHKLNDLRRCLTVLDMDRTLIAVARAWIENPARHAQAHCETLAAP